MNDAADAARFALVSSWRWVVPAAVAVGVLATVTLVAPVPRIVSAAGAAALLVAWVVARVRRPELLVDGEGYRVEEGGRERLRVSFAEIRRARAVPDQQAMYVDCGDPGRNLLLPPRRGFGFRFERQAELYVLLARALADKLVIVPHLETAPPPGTSGVQQHH